MESLISLIPVELAEPGDRFIPCPKTLGWTRATFLDPGSSLYNVEHDHLNSAEIGFLWTNAENFKRGKRIVGTAEIATPPPSLPKWAKARWYQQLKEWFGDKDLDFVVTLYAPYFAGVDEIEQCSGAEHELYHCGQAFDGFGCPKFRKDGRPTFAIRGHDVEEFVGIYRRYGFEAGAGESKALVDIARSTSEITRKNFAGMCGTCQ
jgi:hypothetical protein